jgi:hypothetical protein
LTFCEKEMKKHLITVVGTVILAAGITAIVWHSRSEPNLAAEEPPFNSIALPLRSIRGDIYMDGGSVWVGVEDRNGVSYDFIFPYDHKMKGYPAAFHGAKAPFAPAAVPLANPSRARSIVLGWLRRSDRNNEGLEIAFDYLSGKNRSIIRRVQREGIGGILK